MILFKPEHVPLILNRTKTQTRRLGKCRWKVGSVHKCYTRPPFARGGSEPFAAVRILAVRQEPLKSICTADALAEGYGDVGEFIRVFYRINRTAGLNPLVWVVTFESEQGCDEGYPTGFRVLCHNCNCALAYYGSCPHERGADG